MQSFRSLLLISILLCSSLGSSRAFAGSWTCELGDDGTVIYKMILPATATGEVSGPVRVWVAGQPAGSFSTSNETIQKDELARVRVGQEDPRSNSLLRLKLPQTAPNNYTGGYQLENMPIKKELTGPCVFTP